MADLIEAPDLKLPPTSITRALAASLLKLQARAREKGLRVHHLGAGYPHPEVADPRAFLAHKDAYYQYLADQDGEGQDSLSECYAYADTLGPLRPREAFAAAYGTDWGMQIDPRRLIPTQGATGGINLVCSMLERPCKPIAYLTDAPTFPGFIARATLNSQAAIYSVDMDEEGPIPEMFSRQVAQARRDGFAVYCYYTVPDGHNPTGISFSQRRREEILARAKECGIWILEDAPYLYINYAPPEKAPRPFVSLDPGQTIHLFTASKIGFPGMRMGFLYTEAEAAGSGGAHIRLSDMLAAEASGDMLMHNPDVLRGFEALLHDPQMTLRSSLWPVAEEKLVVYREQREILLEVLNRRLGSYPELFHWIRPDAGFFTVFRAAGGVRFDEKFIERLVTEYGVVTVPMHGFYPEDARARDPEIGLDQTRLSFCFNEARGEERVRHLRDAVEAFSDAMLAETGVVSDSVARSAIPESSVAGGEGGFP